MKKELLIMAIAIGMVAALSANGQQEEDTQVLGRGRGQGRGFNFDSETAQQLQNERQAERLDEINNSINDQELVSINGTLHLENGELPYIEQNDVKYTVSAPWYNLEEVALSDGMIVSVEGYEIPGPRLQWDDSEKVLMLTKAVIDGEEILIEHTADGSGFRGGMTSDSRMLEGSFRGKGEPRSEGMMGRRS